MALVNEGMYIWHLPEGDLPIEVSDGGYHFVDSSPNYIGDLNEGTLTPLILATPERVEALEFVLGFMSHDDYAACDVLRAMYCVQCLAKCLSARREASEMTLPYNALTELLNMIDYSNAVEKLSNEELARILILEVWAELPIGSAASAFIDEIAHRLDPNVTQEPQP